MRLRKHPCLHAYTATPIPKRRQRDSCATTFNNGQWRSTHSQERHHGPDHLTEVRQLPVARDLAVLTRQALPATTPTRAPATYPPLPLRHIGCRQSPRAGTTSIRPSPGSQSAQAPVQRSVSLSLLSLSLSSPSLLLLHDQTCYTTNTYHFLLGRQTLAKYGTKPKYHSVPSHE